MTLGIMQPYLFPYIGYFQLVQAVDVYVIYDDVQHIKRGWINRNNIIVNNQKHLFTISLDKPSTTKFINETVIKDDFVSFQKTLSQAYANAPYSDAVMKLAADICAYPDKNLAKFIGNSLEKIAEYLDMKTEFIYSSTLGDKTHLERQERLISISEQLSADTYINAIGGQELYTKDAFKDKGIDLKFLKPEITHYSQFKNEFIPGLSILDVMMFNSPDEIKKMLNAYQLI